MANHTERVWSALEARDGGCGLCKRDAPLQDSHYLPAGAYRLIANEDCPHPIHVAAGRAFNSSRQYRKSYLCLECETRFNENGERWTLQQLWRPGRFLLQQAIISGQFVYAGKQLRVFDCASIPAIDTAQLGYFAASVFWRGASTAWPGAGTSTERLRLGPYEAQLRAYLLGEIAFPDDCVIASVVAEEDEDILMVLCTPFGGREASGFHRYQFFVPGMLFVLFAGRRIPDALRRTCTIKHRRILLGPLKPAIVEAAGSLARAARASKKLMEGLDAT